MERRLKTNCGNADSEQWAGFLPHQGVTRVCFSFLYAFEKAYYCVPSGVLWEVFGNGVLGLCLNHLVLWARGLFVFLASVGHRTEIRMLNISPLLFVIFIDVACSVSMSSVIPDYSAASLLHLDDFVLLYGTIISYLDKDWACY